MSYEIAYNSLTETEKQVKAVDDCVNYIGQDTVDQLTLTAAQCQFYRHFSMACSFVGIQGYPVVALWTNAKQTMRGMSE